MTFHKGQMVRVLRRSTDEVGTILPGRVLSLRPDQTHIRLVHQRRGLERVARALAAQLRFGHHPKFRIDAREKLIGGVRIALGRLRKQKGHVPAFAALDWLSRFTHGKYTARSGVH